MGTRRASKRAFDVVVAATVLILAAVPMLILALLIRIFLGSPVIFRQTRPGLHGKPFQMIKFRSMTNAKDANGKLLPDDQRLPKFGKLLRATSLDELPELFNVLKGEMSLVGPRPLLMQYLDRYTEDQARRHEALPGITGWAQVNGRNAISWERKFELDVWYIDHWSFGLDLKILWMTVLKVVKRSDISAGDHVTVSEFMGSAESKP